MGSGWTTDSVPPQITTSAIPWRRWSTALEIDSVPDAHADTQVRAPPRVLRSMEIAAAAALGMSMGMVMGRTRRAPFSFITSHASRSVPSPPIPVAKSTRMRSLSSPGSPASAQASRAAMTASCAEGSRRLISMRSRTSTAGTFTRPAKVTGSSCCSTHSSVRLRIPVSLLRRAVHVSRTLPPRGEVAPMPVTTMVVMSHFQFGENNERRGVCPAAQSS